MSYGLAQARYASDAAATVTPARLLTMLYDRLVQDLTVAETAMRASDTQAVGRHLGRAQEILLELHSTLDLAVWPDGEPLARLYLWIVGELSHARLNSEPQRVIDCRDLLQPLREAWHAAASGQTPGLDPVGAGSGIGGAA
ncbi:MAG: flagellar secretion chaperone FliS [Actinomycetota bacterium]|nr:flagellar secretion chaperone FliS [Actinomycetota bacterium]